MEKEKLNQLISKNFNHENGSGLRASAIHYAETGKPSGSMILAIRKFADECSDSELKWHNKSHRPEIKDTMLNFSKQVLIYSPSLKLHSIGWFDFELDTWSHIADEEMDDLVWTYLPFPDSKA